MPGLRTHLAAPLLAIILASATAAAQPTAAQPASQAPARSPRNASYTIDVRLNPRMRTLDATERITWRNITRAATSELQFHLYWNAWINAKSTFLKERGRSTAGRPASDFARLDITSLSLIGGDSPVDLTTAQRFIAPDDGNGDDRTVMVVSLPRPVQPGETIEIEVVWSARVPRTFDRTGMIGNYYFLAQWFPKLGVLEDGGWNCHQFHAGTEFFSDYGVYDVRLTVPAGWTVGATGRERDARDGGSGTTTHHFVQEDVHDFAWTASPDFIVRTERFDEPGFPPVDMRLLMQPEHIGQAARHFAATRSALRRYGQWYGAYPYGHITIVDPAFQSRSDGMEYPTLITGGTSWLMPGVVTLGTPEETVLHEAGHQFWYGLVGTNEFENGWMDEGLNTFSTARALAADFPQMYVERRYFGSFIPWAFRDMRLGRETDIGRLWGYRLGAIADVMTTPTFRLQTRDVEYLAYDKPSAWLATLERWLGWPTLQSAMHRFFEQGEFRHPGPDEFLAQLAHATDRDLSPFFDQTFRGSAVFDYSVDSLTSARSGAQYSTHVVVRRLGDGVFPVDVVVTFRNGEQATEHWDGSARWREFSWDRPVQARSAAVDPGRTLLLDTNFTNNSRTLEPRADAAASKWTLKWMVWLQDALLSWGMLA